MHFTVYRISSDFLLSHLDEVSFLFMPEGFLNTGFIAEEGITELPVKTHACMCTSPCFVWTL